MARSKGLPARQSSTLLIGGIEETSASFEARSAPRSYPTTSGIRAARVYLRDASGEWLLKFCVCLNELSWEQLAQITASLVRFYG